MRNQPMPWDEDRLRAVALEAAPCPDACSADVISLVAEVRRLREQLRIATEALRDIGSRDIIRASEIAWTALEQIEGDDEAIGEAMERQRQPENQA